MNRNVKDGRTQIFVGAEKGHTAAIESLAKLGAEVNKAEKNWLLARHSLQLQ